MDEQFGTAGPGFSNPVSEKGVQQKRKRRFWLVFGAFLAFVLLLFAYIAWRAFDLWQSQQ